MTKIKTAIIGAAGYTGGELLRLLVHHPQCELVYVHSNSQKGLPVISVHPDLIGDCDLVFTDQVQTEGIEAVFLGLPHGETKGFLENHSFSDQTVIIDLSTDFRDESNGFIYGLPEVNKNQIQSSKRIANPGCFATGIQLALLPAISKGWVKETLHLSGITGSTGAGKKLAETSHFSYRTGNMSVYKLFNHQHLKEIKQTFNQVNLSYDSEILFVPYRGNFSRGIWITAYFPFEGTQDEAVKAYQEFYQDAAFTFVSEQDIDLKQAVNTNKCILHVQKQEGQLVIYSAIDNLLKGASGQAVQNFNLAFGMDEKTGLNLKSIAF
ncbi:MAG TPA: N-acetyl-gamma-glutamyl-phosphate reductase [Algoriphagus sp.]|jgi:N-acetyl-gamma-glutamyl-phosphate reductase|uniref:N-acetyl-gamma-glutamyl-phosphate reductase n=1 Tax=unclassified Algoriphagus TaxID=2641541 RepID=UPI000C53EB06|nr:MULTISPECIES: N-acetyl-gamma-glutamyl-phosphate reductase [unclassified Algoriphagus]MAL12037.1 N-acetyl-gamma-glutamyl-phosphate reductase [Algoriphagus sp.]MAN87342.1 N-acetyl-gamma-glutamyl-phosphate reductase [Algoriphagus sp.]QYH38548.1 N-acetyl-gamma-glutamyl-phosphate reductase [Algoriphagus sp. NBT04N3]HAD53153.1 N-acetyl-gamma-glutamyl-phosphate reductase [Algoriphagus sp.]HAZ25963.1 N-acetyl-gamma-glutamyl-phosphate reductase [Algoriphagus sp.]|tara:strand:+ start:1941 stop:2909 length:969 start_codon:yes stop_codon:yes gene_type:complete